MRKGQPTEQENGPHSYWENSSKDKGPSTLLEAIWSTAHHFTEWVINAYLLHQGNFHQHTAGTQKDFKIPKLTAFTCYATIFTFNTLFGQIHNSKQYCCTLGNLPKSHICLCWVCLIFHFVITVPANTILQSISINELPSDCRESWLLEKFYSVLVPETFSACSYMYVWHQTGYFRRRNPL